MTGFLSVQTSAPESRGGRLPLGFPGSLLPNQAIGYSFALGELTYHRMVRSIKNKPTSNQYLLFVNRAIISQIEDRLTEKKTSFSKPVKSNDFFFIRRDIAIEITFSYPVDIILISENKMFPLGDSFGHRSHQAAQDIGQYSLQNNFMLQEITRIILDPMMSDLYRKPIIETLYFGVSNYLSNIVSISSKREAINQDQSFVDKLNRLIDENIGVSDLRLRDVAQSFGVSSTTLTNKVRKHYGTSFHRLVIERKLSEAKRLMEGNRRLVDIAFHCGFSSQSHFSQVFKKYFGISPATYRKSTRRM